MASLLRKLQGPNAQSRGSANTIVPSATSSFPASTHMFLVEVIAFGEVYAVPVTKATPATVVLRYVMEAAVSPEDAARMGNTEATLYYKEKPLPLDTVMGKLPRRAVLHLHLSLATSASVVRDRRQSAVSMLPQSRQRFSQTTVTMQPILKDGGREGSGSTAAGISSEGSPSVERLGSLADPLSVAPSGFDAVSAAMPMLFSPAMMPMYTAPAPGIAYAAAPMMMPSGYCLSPVGAAGPGMQLLRGPQGRTVSAPCLTASRRRDSAVEFANSYRFPSTENPLTEGFLTAVAVGETTSPRPSAPANASVARRSSAPADERHYVVVYLRLPRDQAAARLSAAALSADCTVEMEAVEPSEVPLDQLLNTTFSTVNTSKSLQTRAYAYRRLRVRRDFPVGTLRELCAVNPRHRLHFAHAEVTNEKLSFAELNVPANAVFYFKAAFAKGSGPPAGKARTLTRERLREHLEAGGDGVKEVMEDSPSHIDDVHASLDRSLPSPLRPDSPQRRVDNNNDSSNIISSVSSVSIHERIEAFNGGAVRNLRHATDGGHDDKEGVCTPASLMRYSVEGRELTLTSAMAAEWARRQAEQAARQAEAETEALEWEEDVNVDVTPEAFPEAPAPTLSTARGMTQKESASGEKQRQISPDPVPQALSAADAVASTAAGEVKAGKATSGTSLGDRRSAFRWMRRNSHSSTTAGAEAEVQPLSSAATSPSRSSSVSSSQRGLRAEGFSRALKARSRRTQSEAGKQAATAAATAEVAPPLVQAEFATTTTTLTSPPTAKKQKKSKKAALRPGTPVSAVQELHSHAATPPLTRSSRRSSSLSSSLKAKIHRLTRRTSKDAAAPATTGAPQPAAVVPPTAADEALAAMKRKSERVSRKKAAVAATDTESTDKEAEAKAQSPSLPATAAAAATATPVKEQVRRSSPTTPLSYSERRRRQSADTVPCQPVAFLGAHPKNQRSVQSETTNHAANTASTPEEVSATLGPAALSTTRVPTPRASPAPVSILVSPSPEEQQRRRDSKSPRRTLMTEVNVQHCRRSPTGNARSESPRAATPDYSVESTGSVDRLRITIRDPEEATRFHYGVPVEPDCPVGMLREWISAMQHPSSATGKPTPSLRNVDRYGIFVGDTYLVDEMRVTFGAVTGGRNDAVFSIRKRL